MASNLSLAVKLTLSSAEFRAALKSSNDEVRTFAEKVGTQLRAATASAKGTADSFSLIGGAAKLAAASAAGLYGAFQLQDLARDAFQAAVAFDRQQKALQNVAGSASQAASDFAFLRDVGDRMGTSVNDLAASWLSFGNAIKDSALEGQTGRDVFAGIVSTLADMNASSEQTNAVLFQVAQGINKEKVQLEDLNIIAERGIPIFRMLAEALGITKAELFDQIGKGLIPADEAYRKVFGTVDNGTRRIEGMTQSLNRLSGEWNEFLVNLGNSAPIQGAIDALGGLLKQLNDVSEATKAVAVPTLSADAAQLEQKRSGLEFQMKELTSNPFGANKVAVERITQQLREVERQQQLVQLLAAPKEQAAAEQSLFEKVTAEQLRARPAPTEPVKYDKQKAAAIADYLESRGLSPLAVAGIVGNLAQEAPGGAGNFGTAMSGDQGSVGLAQWRLERKDELLKFAATQGAPATDIKVQLDFLVAEAKRRGDLDAVNAARSPAQAAEIFMRRFERPEESAANLDYRQAVAEDVFAQSSLDRLRLASRAKTEPSAKAEKSGVDEEARLSEELTRIEEQRTEVIVKQREELRQQGIETYEQMVSDLQQAADEERQIISARGDYERQINAQAEADFTRSQSVQRDFLESAFDEKLISASDYYAALQKLADTELQHTQQRIDAEIELEKGRLAEINKTIEILSAKSQNTTDLQVQQIESLTKIESLTAQKTTANEQFRSTSREITVDATAAQTETTAAATNPIEKWANDFNKKLGDMSSFAFSAAQGMQNAFAEFFESGMQGTESLGQAFAKMARRIAAEIAAMMMTKAIISFIGMIGGGLSGLFSSAAAVPSVGATAIGASTPGLATGGLVGDPERTAMTAINGSVQKLIDSSQIQVIRGPGNGTSDSIAAELPIGSYIIREQAMRAMRFADGGTVKARVSAGEGFVPPSAVRAIGVEALDRINGLGAGLRTFAAGGLVDSAMPAAGQSIVEGDTITVNMPLTVSGMAGGQDAMDAGAKAQALKRELREAVDARVVELQRPGGLLWGSRG